jgi:FKBP-type peptidyl-prolyl cis-trans isomerase 2
MFATSNPPQPSAQQQAGRAAVQAAQARTAEIDFAMEVTGKTFQNEAQVQKAEERLAAAVDAGHLTTAQASGAIKSLKLAPAKPTAEQRADQAQAATAARLADQAAAKIIPTRAEILAMTPQERQKLWDRI